MSNGWIVTWLLIVAIALLTVWVKRDEWFPDRRKWKRSSWTSPSATPATPAATPRVRVRSRNIWPLAAFGLAFVLVVGAFLWWNRSKSEPTTSKPDVTTRTTVVAPVAPEWSKVIVAKGLLQFYPEEGEISIQLTKGNTVSTVSGITRFSGKAFGKYEAIQFQSDGDDPINVTVIE